MMAEPIMIYDSRNYQVLIDAAEPLLLTHIYDSRNYQVLIDGSKFGGLMEIYDSRNYQVLIDFTVNYNIGLTSTIVEIIKSL